MNSNYYYTQPAQVAPVNYSAAPAQPAQVAPVSYNTATAEPAPAAAAVPAQAVSAQTVAATTATTTVSFSTSTAQGVANIMASRSTVGHWGGNPGYEGCGSGFSAAQAYNNCCYSNSGMATVDVGYAQGAGGMWYCCRRYR